MPFGKNKEKKLPEKSSFFHLYVVICKFMTHLLCIKIFCSLNSFVTLCTYLLIPRACKSLGNTLWVSLYAIGQNKVKTRNAVSCNFES